MNPAGKAFLVTGGASGLGEAAVRALAARGAMVLIADRDAERGAALEAELDGAARFVRTDVTDETNVAAAVDRAVSAFGALHGAIQCAGVAAAMRLVGKQGPHPLDLFKLVLDVNVVGTFNAMRFSAQAMAANEPDAEGERGVLINTASVAAFDGQIGQTAYAASKGAVAAMTLPAARELARSGVRVVTIAPGLFDTPMMAGLPEEAKDSLGAQVPFPSRLGRPGEFAALALHIIENTMLNGEVIRLDGAIRMQPK